MQIVIASKNLNKVREYKVLLKSIGGLDVLSLIDFPEYQPKEETGSSFEENAVAKAKDAAQALNAFVIADDSGLVVPALNGEPGLYSSRYAGQNASDRENRLKLIEKIQELSEESRAAYFECVIALASPSGDIKVAHATCEGRVITEERGNKGFGYDPIFVKYDYNKTFAELEEEMKNAVSHRRKAFDKIAAHIEATAQSV